MHSLSQSRGRPNEVITLTVYGEAIETELDRFVQASHSGANQYLSPGEADRPPLQQSWASLQDGFFRVKRRSGERAA